MGIVSDKWEIYEHPTGENQQSNSSHSQKAGQRQPRPTFNKPNQSVLGLVDANRNTSCNGHGLTGNKAQTSPKENTQQQPPTAKKTNPNVPTYRLLEKREMTLDEIVDVLSSLLDKPIFVKKRPEQKRCGRR